MDRKTIQTRKALGYEIDENELSSDQLAADGKIPGWVFGYSGLASFVVGAIGMGIELSNDDLKYLPLYFSLSFLLAPALLIYPVFRYIVGKGKTELSAILSVLFGLYIHSNVKKKMDKWG
ncbi:MAG: hypothetical protein GXP21_01580 [Gammaproteobacteria bacterium]|nr:hypothetical protein [Gammaproteobacteria bacterium]